jgi:DNA-binding beta-propeller fold protein YncE
MTRSREFLGCLLLTATMSAAPESGVRGPSVGFVLDPSSHSIRPIQGMPGASLLGQPLDLPFAIDQAVFSSQGDLAVVFGGARVSLVRGLRSGSPEVVALPVSIANADSATWSGSGSAALIYSRGQSQLQVISGLRAAAIAGPVIDCSTLPGSIVSAALDGSASNLLVGIKVDGAGSVLSLRPDASGGFTPFVVLGAHMPSTILFVNQDRDALVADSEANRIVRIQDVNGSATVTVVADADHGIASPVGVQLSADGKSVLVANAGSNTVTVHSLDGSTPVVQVPLPVVPSRLDRLNREPVLLLNDMTSGPLYVLDEAGGRQIYFVPIS